MFNIAYLETLIWFQRY